MSDAENEVVLHGRPASGGLVLAPLVVRHPTTLGSRRSGPPAVEERALTDALSEAAAQLEALAAGADDAARGMLEFQLALLEDEDLIAPAFAAIAGGTSAHDVWRDVLDREIAEYRASGDEVLEARAADLADLRDRVLSVLMPASSPAEASIRNGRAILAAEDLTPSRFLETDWRRFAGVVLKHGSAAGHVALLARARGTPLVIGLGDDFDRLRDGALAVLDADRAMVVVDPGQETVAAAERQLVERAGEASRTRQARRRPAVTASGERVVVAINVDDPALLETVDPADTDGIGLTRTEFLFKASSLPDEERQVEAYKAILRWAAGRPVNIRTLDAGGDKPIPGVTPEGEANPFLGLRGLRLSLARPEVFRLQLRALARAAACGPLQVMAPMVSVPAEFTAFRRLFARAVEELAAAGVDAALPRLGVMIEVPAAALTAGDFDADFYSIGSNDLVQYTLAVARDNGALAELYDSRHPAVLELIGRVMAAARRRGVEVSLCGDMASDPRLVPDLLGLGLRRLSVAPATLGAVKAAIAAWPASRA